MALSLRHQSEGNSEIGSFLGWAMAAIYMGGRLPQIWLNIRRGNVEGLNPLMFIFALVGNVTYVASILVSSLEWSRLRPNLPWLVDAGGCVLLDTFAVLLTKFDYRLANKLETVLQKLRCRINYHALQFTDPICKMGEELVKRMRMRNRHFIALHLRFEPDMLPFSGCYYGGREKERRELGAIRRRWKTLHSSNPDKERRQGKCLDEEQPELEDMLSD